MMESTKATGHLLCLLPFPEPTPVTDRIKKRHPGLKFTYYQFSLKVDWTKGEALPNEIWNDVTVLCTLSQFPSNLTVAPRLKLVHLFSTGTDHIWSMPIYAESSIAITTSSGVPAPMIAEWVIMNILVTSHKYNTLREWQLKHAWDESGGGKALFTTVSSTVGKRIGILGYGAVGRQVANVSQSMGMEIIAYTANPRKSQESKRYNGYGIPTTGDPEGKVPSQWFSGTDKKSLHEFLAQGMDYLLVSLPRTKTTRNLLSQEEFEILSNRNTFIINISRGDVLDQGSLIKALRAYQDDFSNTLGESRKGLSGAALDVAVPEPLPKDHPLWEAPNCIISPHISGISREYGAHAFQVLETNLQLMAEGKTLLNQVDRKTGYTSAVAKI